MMEARHPNFAELLLAHRRAARLSQLDLALEAGTSQRHLSFLESGRSRPGRAVAEALAEALRLPPIAANELLQAAGFAAMFREHRWNEAAMAPIRSAAQTILRAHMPYPALLIDAANDVIAANAGFDAVLGVFGDAAAIWARTHDGEPRNLLRLSLHPDGPAAQMLDFESVARATLARALREAPYSARLRAVLDDIARFPNIDPAWLNPAWGPAPAPVIEERYRIGGQVYGVFAIVTTMGAPMDLTGGSLRIESYFPLDSASAAFLDRVTANIAGAAQPTLANWRLTD